MLHYIEQKLHHYIAGEFAKTFIRQATRLIEIYTCTKFKKSDNSSSEYAIVFSRAGKRFVCSCAKW